MLKDTEVISKTRVRIIRGYQGTPDKWLHVYLTSAGKSKQPRKTLIFDDCQYVHFYEAEVEGFTAVGHPLKGKDFGIETRNCHSVNLVSPKMLGAPDDSTKEAWLATVGNGIKTHANCSDITIINPTIDSIHVGICAMGENTRVEKGSITRFSGDDLQFVNHGCQAIGVKLAWFLRVLPYKHWHGDFVQVFWPDNADRTYFKGIKIRDCHIEAWENKAIHKWCSSPDQVALISDGMADGAEFISNKIYTDCPIVLLSNPCVNSLATDNDIYVTLPTQARAAIVMTFDDDRKNYGCSPKNNIVDDNRQHVFNPDARSLVLGSEALKIGFEDVQKGDVFKQVFDDIFVKPSRFSTSDQVVPGTKNIFAREVLSLANKGAPAVTDADYAVAAERLVLSLRMIKSVGIVESRGDGYNSDGSLKTLYERHKSYKFCKDAGCLALVKKILPADIFARKAGGYEGGLAEYSRAEEACIGITKALMEKPAQRVMPSDNSQSWAEEKALDIVLRSKSWGGWQIMGFNHKLAGYSTALEMVQAFHQSEAVQLDGFCSFLEKTGLVKHLREAERLIDAGKNPRPALNKFAIGYNGKKHKNYDAKIAAEYRKQSPDPVEFDSMGKSRITWGSGTSIVAGTTATVSVITELTGVLETAVEKKDEIAETVSNVKTNIGALKDGAEALKDGATQVVASTTGNNWLLWLLLALLIISNLGSILSLWARFTDRWAGKN
ncbi:DUF3380 domain-containing protein [Leucothrix sargassi]|nr:DUF3380 domain-containing protein [Leucothrix sargassi]